MTQTRVHPERVRGPENQLPSPLATATDELCDQHAAPLLSLATAMTQDPQRAEQAVVEVISAVAQTATTCTARQELARRVYGLCATTAPSPSGEREAGCVAVTAQQQTALALVAWGGLAYREVADLMRLTPATTARLLAAALRDQGGSRAL